MKFIEGSIENMHPNLRVYRVKYKSALAAFIIFVKPAPVPTYEDDCNVINTRTYPTCARRFTSAPIINIYIYEDGRTVELFGIVGN